MTQPIIITHSDLSMFLMCRRRWGWSYVQDFQKPESLVGPLALGSRVHASIEEHYRDGTDPVAVHAELARAAVDEAEAAGLPPWTLDQLYEDIIVGRNCVVAHQDWLEKTGEDSMYEVYAVEDTIEAPILGGRVVLRGKTDVIFRHIEDGRLYVNDLKGLAIDTPLPTPTGWTSMGDVKVGDALIGSDGVPCKVVEKSAVTQKPCFKMRFSDGTSIVCDEDHLWSVIDVNDRARTEKVLSAAEIADTVSTGRQSRYAIANAAPLSAEEATLPLDPYVLGYWLGDGCTGTTTFAFGERDLGEALSPIQKYCEELGCWTRFNVDPRSGVTAASFSFGHGNPLRDRLREIGVLDDKHIPAIYLRASVEQRTELLRGLMDSDGTWNAGRREAVIGQKRELLARQIRELVLSLGEKCRINKANVSCNGNPSVAWMVTFKPQFNPFKNISFKRDQFVASSSVRTASRTIVSCEPCETVDTQCVSVDSPDSTYICGTQWMVTHNTAGQWGGSQRELLERSYQHHVYLTILRLLNDPRDVAGAMYTVMRKLKRPASATGPLVERFRAPATLRMAEAKLRQIERICGEMVDALDEVDAHGSSVTYPSPQMGCSFCEFKQPCELADESPAAARAMLDAVYVRGSRHKRYGQ